MKKSIVKSKTVWVNLAAIGYVLFSPESMAMICNNPDKSVLFLSVASILARVYKSDITIKENSK